VCCSVLQCREKVNVNCLAFDMYVSQAAKANGKKKGGKKNK